MRRWLPAAFGFCLTTATFLAWIASSNTYEMLLVDPTLSTSVVDSRLLKACGAFAFAALAGAVVAYLFFRTGDYRTVSLVGGMGRTVGLLLAALVAIDVVGHQHSSLYTSFATTALADSSTLAVVAGIGGFAAPFAAPLRLHMRKFPPVLACASWLYVLLYWFLGANLVAATHDTTPAMVAALALFTFFIGSIAWLKPLLVHETVES